MSIASGSNFLFCYRTSSDAGTTNMQRTRLLNEMITIAFIISLYPAR